MARRVIGTAEIQVKADTSGFRSSLNGLSGAFGGISGSLGALKGAIAALGLGKLAKDAVSFGASYRVQLDNASAAVHGLIENQTEADELMRKMTEFAVKTPFDLPGIQEATTMLLSYGESFGVTSDNVLDYVDTIGNAAAATGKGSDAMLNVITTLGKISGQGRIMTRDMNQLTANFPSLHPWEVLADLTGKSVEELRGLAIKPGGLAGVVDTTTLIDALVTEMENLPGAAGAMERKMDTLGGAFEYFKDAAGVAVADALNPFFEVLQDLLKSDAVLELITGLADAFGTLASEVITQLAPVLPDLAIAFQDILLALVPAAPAIADLAEIFAIFLVSMTPTIETLAELAAMFTNFLVQLDPGILKVITTALLSLWAGMSLPAVLAAAAIGAVVYLVQQHWDTIVEATRTVMDTLSGLLDWDAIVENVQGAMDRIGAALDWEAIGEDISNALDSVMDAVAEVGDALSDIWSNIPFKEQATDLFRWFVDTVPGWFGDAVARIQSYFKPIMAGLQDVADQIEPVWEALKRLTAIVIAVLSPIIGLVVAVGLAFANFAKKFVGPAVTMVGEMLGNLLSIVGNVIGFIANIIMFRWGDAWENVKAIVGNAIGVVSDVIGLWVHTIATLFSSMFETVTQIWGFLWERVQGVWDAFYAAVLEPIGGFISAIIGWFQLLYDVLVGNSIIPDLVNAIIGFFTTLWTTIETIVTTIKDIVVAVWEAIKLAVETVVGAIVLVVQTAWEGMKVVVETAVNAIKTVVETVWGAIKTAVQTAVDGIKTALGTAWDGIKTAAETAWDLVHDYIVDPLQEAWDWVKDTFSTIVETLGGLWDDIETAASTGWNLIKDAIIGPFEAAWEKVKEIAGWITDKVGWVIDMVGKLPFVGGGGIDFDAAKQAQEEGGFAKGGFGNFGAGTPTVLHGREVIIPVSSPGRAWELMQQSGLDRLAAAMSQGRGPTVSGPLVSMPGAIIQDATDAQVVAQQTAAALTALVAA